MATNGNEQVATAVPANEAANPAGSNLSKDEVGWYFVEQFYTTLSKSPEKLHLFYSKRSQFVYGVETEVTNVSVGRQAIQDRIKKLDFQDCKVRVSNVDSQASFDNIVIQVIGEVSNKSGEPKKFVQTFVLAQQPSGYFVLNDILRYVNEDSEEEVGGQGQQDQAQEPEHQVQSPEVEAESPATEAETAAPEPVVEAEAAAVQPEPVQPQTVEADLVDEKFQEVATGANDAEAAVEVTAEVPEPAAPEAQEPAPTEVDIDAAKEAVEETAEAEKPKESAPVPVAKAAAPAPEPAPVEQPAAPPKPMTWASRAAAAAGPRPVVPLTKTATPPAAAQTRAPAPTPATASVPASAPAASVASATAPAPASQPAAVAAPVASVSAEAPGREASGWQTAGADSKRQNRPQSMAANVTEKEGTMGYVKYVTEKVQESDLRSALAAHGELTYFDINRGKNCAFVEYKTMEAYQTAIASNPHVVNGENIIVEPRRPKATTYGGGNYGSGRGGASGRGRGGFDGNRGGQGNLRGNFPGQSRGRGGAARARGGISAPTS